MILKDIMHQNYFSLVHKLTSSDDQQLKIRFHITRGLGNNFNKIRDLH